ncbi:MAG: hypothetical protein DA328_05355 [Nitrososphaeraceae archaeon]|nr:hypothetical protein [Nitrososphaeraceae archaeon]
MVGPGFISSMRDIWNSLLTILNKIRYPILIIQSMLKNVITTVAKISIRNIYQDRTISIF